MEEKSETGGEGSKQDGSTHMIGHELSGIISIQSTLNPRLILRDEVDIFRGTDNDQQAGMMDVIT